MKILTINLTAVKLFVNTTQPLLSSSENSDCNLIMTVNLTIIKFLVNATQS